MTMQITTADAAVAAAASVPVTKLIDSVSKAIGALWEPIGILRKANAQVQANLILVNGSIEERELLERAIHRFTFVESRRQANIESITEEAKHHLPNAVGSEPVSEDWMAHFVENCKDVSEKDLQRLWARLLAGEVAQPRTFSRRALETLRTFSPQDARVFNIYCDDAFVEKSTGTNLIFVGWAEFGGVPGTGVTDSVNHLVSLGLLNAGVELVPCLMEDWMISYCGKEYVVPRNPGQSLGIRKYKVEVRRFTVVGNELAKIVSRSPRGDFVQMLQGVFSKHQLQLLSLEEFQQHRTQVGQAG